MSFRNLEYFIVTSEILNISKAAEQLHISQQALSNRILKLEAQLGVSLFDRTSPMSLTYAGERLLVGVKELLETRTKIQREMADISNCTKGKLTIGISHTRGRALLPKILPKYHKKYPDIELSVLEGNSEFLENAIIRNKIDLMIGLLPFGIKNLETVELMEDHLILLLPDRFMNKINPLNWNMEQFKNCPFLMVGKDNRFRDKIDEYLYNKNIKPNILLEAENIETLLELCIKGMGITFYEDFFIHPEYQFFQDSSSCKVAVLSLKDIKSEVMAIGYYKPRYLTFASKEFIQMVKKLL